MPEKGLLTHSALPVMCCKLLVAGCQLLVAGATPATECRVLAANPTSSLGSWLIVLVRRFY